MRFSPVFALCLAGCAASPVALRTAPSVQRPRVVEIAPARPWTRGVGALPPPSPSLPTVAEPADVACRLESDRWTQSSLRVSPRGPVFARVLAARSAVVFPIGGEPSAATAVFDTAEVQLRGYVAAEDLPVYLGSPRALGGFVYPHAHTALAWVGGKRSALRVQLPTSRSPVVLESLSEEVGCDGLSPMPAEYDPRTVITKHQALQSLVVLQGGSTLSLEPNGPAVARLAAFATVEVLTRRGGFTRVLLPSGAYTAVGWVASSDLGKGLGTGSGRLAGRHVYRRHHYGEGRACERDLDLTALVDGERVGVGTLRAGARFNAKDLRPEEESGLPPPRSTEDRPERWVSVFIHGLSWLELAEGARLEVRREDLAGCAPQL